MKQLAQGIASFGRGGDTELIHMTKGEIRGLQQLALAHGGSLTTNPHTGLPEAGFLSSMLPMLIGGALSMTGVGAPLAALMVGGGYGLAKGSLKEGLMAGLGAYGGAGLGSSLGEMGAEALAKTPESYAKALGVEGAAAGPGSQAAMLADQTKDFGLQGLQTTAEGAVPNSTMQLPKYADMDMGQRADSIGRGFQQVNPLSDSFDKKTAMGFLDKNKYQLAGALAGPALEAMKPQAAQGLPKQEPDEYDRRLAKYHIADNYQPYTPAQPNPYYRAQYAKGGVAKYEGRDPRSASIPDVGIIKLDDISTASKDPYEAALIRLKEAANRANLNYAAPTIASTPASPALKGLGDIGKPTMMMAEGGVTGMADGGYTYNAADGTYTEEAPQNNMFSGANAGSIRNLMKQVMAHEKMAQGGITSLPSEYAAGGKLLQGPGDGMSDSIPAVIKGPRPQRAALAQGEFVIPADVVSHLGNGSTDAGAKKLYAMMDKIRHARTGNKKQGKQINPNKFMPA